MKKVILFGMLLVLFSCTENDSNFESQKKTLSNSKPSTLKYQLVDNMIKNYRSNQLHSIENSIENPVTNDAQAIWFNIETLKKFIADVEAQTQKNSEKNDSKLGIRMYYAAYPEKNKWGTKGFEDLSILLNDPITQLYEKKHTLIMIPTISVNGINKDFNPMDINTYNGFNNVAKSNYKIMSVSDNDSNITAQNHGNLIPPGDDSGVLGF